MRREKDFEKQGCSGNLANSTRSPRREKSEDEGNVSKSKDKIFSSRKAERQGLRQGGSKYSHYSQV